MFATRAGPDEAYEFAKGNPIQHPAGFDIQLDRPLDFQGVADHANYLGMLPAMMDPGSPAYNHPAAETVRTAQTVTERRGIFRAMQPYVRYMEDADPSIREHLDKDVVRSAWSEIAASANRHYEPGVFTTFIAYEYTSAGAGGIYENLHRNVVFRGAEAPDIPFSRLDSYNPEDLWARMDEWRADGFEAIAIPHNTNGSGGRMFEYEYFEGGAIDQAYSDLRSRNEPVVEITQTKGTSETHPALSPNDEWAGFEIMPYRVSTSILSEPPGSYVRNAFRRGLEIEAGGVSNPYKLGVIGSSDTHVAAGAFDEETYWGASGLMQATGEQRGSLPGEPAGAGASLQDPSAAAAPIDDGTGRIYPFTTAITNGASGLAAVWANENTRESIFDAMRRKETFGTSGTRIQVRFFGGAELSGLDLDAPDLVAAAYETGVAMGGDLTGESGGDDSEAPSFLVWAMQDTMAAPLQRVQIVKGWESGGETAEHGLRRRLLRRPRSRPGHPPLPRQRRHRRSQRLLNQHRRRRRRTQDDLDRPRLRPRPARLLLRPGPREPHLPLVELGRPASRYSSPPGLPGNHPGTRLVVADLVHALVRGLVATAACRVAPTSVSATMNR